jgi:hypothetical protein
MHVLTLEIPEVPVMELFISIKHFAISIWYLPNRVISRGFNYEDKATSF